MHILNLGIGKCFKGRHYFAIHTRGIKGSNLTHRAVPLCFSVCALAFALPIGGWAPALAAKPRQIKVRENREE